MAILYFHPSFIPNRSKQPLLSRMAYHAGERLTDTLTGKSYGVDKPSTAVSHQAITLPKSCPDGFRHRETLWNALNQTALAKTESIALRLNIIMPFELTEEVNWQLAMRYLERSFIRQHFITDAVFRTLPMGHHKQPMLVIMLPILRVNEEGFEDKPADFNACRFMTRCRLRWVRYANRELKLRGLKTLKEPHPLIAQQVEMAKV